MGGDNRSEMVTRMPATPLPFRTTRAPVRVLLYGGTFDPPHRFHARLPRAVADRVLGERAHVVYVPAARNPLKRRGPVASDADRVAMLRLTLGGTSRAHVWTDEIDREGASYTIDTVRRLKRLLPAGSTVRLLIGADSAAGFHRWKSARAVVREAEPLVMPRTPIVRVDELFAVLALTDYWSANELAAWCGRMAPVGPEDMSSTRVREVLAAGGRPRELDDEVVGYIASRGLYRG
jgi:nicotinate-nucleotide adenylyltransferase